MNKNALFPFTAIVDQERMKKSLILNAINQKIGGVLIQGEKGTAKSTAVRALANLLPKIQVVEDCVYKCDPHNINEMCSHCKEKSKNGEKLPIKDANIEVVDLPLGATEDRVIGTLDIEHAIKKGEKNFEPGILARVNRGILYVDEINLLDDHLVDVLLDAAAMGVNYIQRESISFSHPARFILIGTMNPEEGDLRPQLLDRFGLCVNIEGISDPDKRIQILERGLQYENGQSEFVNEWSEKEKELSARIQEARKLLPEVTYNNEIFQLIVSIAIETAVDGHRADLFMLKTAMTIAAFHLRREITPDDVQEAAELVIGHRMRKRPFQDPGIEKEKLQETIEKHKKKLKI